MDAQRIKELRAALEAESISYGEAAEIEEAFEKIDPATLPEPAENATLGDMLDEIESRMTRDHNYEVDVIFCVTARNEEEAWEMVNDQLFGQNVDGWVIPDEAVTYVGEDD